MKHIFFTPEGYEKLLTEQRKLIAQRPSAVEELSKARAMGDLSENGYYKSAKFKLVGIDRRLREMKYLLQYAEIVKKGKTGAIEIGSKVVLSGGVKSTEYMIVGSYESDPMLHKISHVSPLGKALIGKRKNETVIISAPKGKITYSILKIA